MIGGILSLIIVALAGNMVGPIGGISINARKETSAPLHLINVEVRHFDMQPIIKPYDIIARVRIEQIRVRIKNEFSDNFAGIAISSYTQCPSNFIDYIEFIIDNDSRYLLPRCRNISGPSHVVLTVGRVVGIDFEPVCSINALGRDDVQRSLNGVYTCRRKPVVLNQKLYSDGRLLIRDSTFAKELGLSNCRKLDRKPRPVSERRTFICLCHSARCGNLIFDNRELRSKLAALGLRIQFHLGESIAHHTGLLGSRLAGHKRGLRARICGVSALLDFGKRFFANSVREDAGPSDYDGGERNYGVCPYPIPLWIVCTMAGLGVVFAVCGFFFSRRARSDFAHWAWHVLAGGGGIGLMIVATVPFLPCIF